MDGSDLIVPLLTGLLGGSVIAAVVTHYLKKRETKVILDKTKAETDKIIAETNLIRNNLKDVQTNINETADTVQQQREIIDKLVLFSMSGFIFGHLEHILSAQKTGRPYKVDDIDKVRGELKFLKDHGYIWDFNPNHITRGRNIAEVIRLTDIAQWFVPLRLETEKKEREKH